MGRGGSLRNNATREPNTAVRKPAAEVEIKPNDKGDDGIFAKNLAEDSNPKPEEKKQVAKAKPATPVEEAKKEEVKTKPTAAATKKETVKVEENKTEAKTTVV